MNIVEITKIDTNEWKYFHSILCYDDSEASLNATFSNISAISWQPVLVVEEIAAPGENHRPWASNW
jgi:hypothetical protein